MFEWLKNKDKKTVTKTEPLPQITDDMLKTSGSSSSQSGSSRMVYELETFVCTATGNRQYQQDAAYVTPTKIIAANKKSRVLAIVCDGMGGMADGGKASQTAIQMMRHGFDQIEKTQDPINIPAFFHKGIVSIDQVINSFPKENGKGSGTTMVACIAEDDKLYWASVGDSRIYILRDGRITQMTRDHNYWLRLQEQVKAGEITMEEAKSKKQKEALISFLGMGNITLMDIRQTAFEMKEDDVVMLCSDGITKTLPKGMIEHILLANAVKPEKKAQALVEAATHKNSHNQDNTTCALIHYHKRDIKKTI